MHEEESRPQLLFWHGDTDYKKLNDRRNRASSKATGKKVSKHGWEYDNYGSPPLVFV